MKAKFIALLGVACLFSAYAIAGDSSQDKAKSQAKAKLAIPRIKKIAADPAVVAAIKEQNTKKTRLSEIQKQDSAWMSGDTTLSDQILSRPCSQKLKHILEQSADLTEAFAMDDQGSNVCMSNRTSDYWQGDEPKFEKSFNNGKGAVFVDERRVDNSAKAVIVQVSVPVMDNGKAIGALTVGVKSDVLIGSAGN